MYGLISVNRTTRGDYLKNGVKMLDIANKLGVSVVTVSNAIAGRDGVSDETRKKICETAEKMGYKPSNTKIGRKRSYIQHYGTSERAELSTGNLPQEYPISSRSLI